MQGGGDKTFKHRPANRAEDLDTARLVARFQAGDREAYATIYTRYFGRVFSYLKVLVKDPHDAEDLAQQVFLQVLEALPRYERRRQPFRAWLFTVVRNAALTELQKNSRVEPVDPDELNARRERALAGEELPALDWITDVDMMAFVSRLPLPQRQVLLLRFLLNFTNAEIARILGRTPTDVRTLQYRALLFLEKHLRAIGRAPKVSPKDLDAAPMRRWGKPAPVLRERRFALH